MSESRSIQGARVQSTATEVTYTWDGVPIATARLGMQWKLYGVTSEPIVLPDDDAEREAVVMTILGAKSIRDEAVMAANDDYTRGGLGVCGPHMGANRPLGRVRTWIQRRLQQR